LTKVTAIKAWYKEPYVWLIIAFPLAAVIGGIATIILAIQSDSGMVVDDYYKQGLEINLTLDRDRAAADYGLKASLQYAKDNKQIRLIIGAANNFNYPDKLNVSFLNASRDGLDRQQTLTRSGQATYLGPNPELGKGKWHIIIESDDWRLLDVIHVP